MPNYIFRTDTDSTAVTIAALSEKIVTVKRISVGWHVEVSEDLTESEIASIKSTIAYRAVTRKTERESGPIIEAVIGSGIELKASASKIDAEQIDVITDQEWTSLCGIVTTPGFFVSCPTRVAIRFIGDLLVAGSGAQLRLVQQLANNSEPTVIGEYSPSDTGGAWLIRRMDNAEQATLSTCRFTVEARLNGATSLAARFFSLSLLEKI